MKITPLEVHNHQFGTSFRGFDRDEVRAFLAIVSEEYEQAISENARLKDQMTDLREQLARRMEREKTIEKALQAADRIGQEMKDNARREGDLMVKEARLKANKLLEQTQSRVLGLEDRVQELKVIRDQLDHQLRTIVEDHLRTLDRSRSMDEEEKIFPLRRPTSA
ncbi:MAG: DivIVA domain-containing protein [Acidobacteriota bacterium]